MAEISIDVKGIESYDDIFNPETVILAYRITEDKTKPTDVPRVPGKYWLRYKIGESEVQHIILFFGHMTQEQHVRCATMINGLMEQGMRQDGQ